MMHGYRGLKDGHRSRNVVRESGVYRRLSENSGTAALDYVADSKAGGTGAIFVVFGFGEVKPVSFSSGSLGFSVRPGSACQAEGLKPLRGGPSFGAFSVPNLVTWTKCRTLRPLNEALTQ